MIALHDAERHLLVLGDLVGLVILRHPFVEPSRDVRLADARVEHEMRVFVKDRAERIGNAALDRKGDVVYVAARLEITRYSVIRFPVRPPRLERAIRTAVLEYDHRCFDRAVDLKARVKGAERRAKLLELRRDRSDVLFGCIADQIEILRFDADPLVRGIRRLACRQNKENKGDEDKTTLHKNRTSENVRESRKF